MCDIYTERRSFYLCKHQAAKVDKYGSQKGSKYVRKLIDNDKQHEK